jgi:outer membrane biosynthesis protein TonB
MGGPGTAGSPGARTAVDLEAVTRVVHARLAGAARDCYPPAARRFRQVGRVPLRFCVSDALAAEQVVVTPSGAGLLDEAARECVVRRAAPFPAEAAARCFEVAVDFGP